MSNHVTPDPYGNLGVIPNASWSDRWVLFSHSQRENYFADVASWALLSVAQMEQLVQGLPPQPSNWLPTNTSLVDSLPSVIRLHEDIERGVLSRAPTVPEFVAWCDARRVEVHESLLAGLQKKADASEDEIEPQSTVTIEVPIWAPLRIQGETGNAEEKKRRGRPRTTKIRYDALIAESRDYLIAAAEKGRKLTVNDVAQTIAKRPAGEGLSWSNIARRLKGKLPLDQAKATADRHAHAIANKRFPAS